MAVIKFLTEEEVACEIEDDSQYMMIQSQITYLHSCVEQWWVKGRGGGGEGGVISETGWSTYRKM